MAETRSNHPVCGIYIPVNDKGSRTLVYSVKKHKPAAPEHVKYTPIRWTIAIIVFPNASKHYKLLQERAAS